MPAPSIVLSTPRPHRFATRGRTSTTLTSARWPSPESDTRPLNSSWLVDLIAAALVRSPELDEFSGRVSDSGEGRWTVLAAVDEGVPAPVITTSLYSRFESRELGEFTAKVLSAMRSEFGGHAEKK